MTAVHNPPLIADIKRNSLDDGPGIRTTVFFKGCPLSCVWCQNPETKSISQQIVYEGERCIGCGECMKACGNNAISLKPDGGYPIDKANCLLCGKCVEVCTSEALHFAGTAYDTDQLCRKLLRDEIFYKNSHGGVTFSGGEPTLHMVYLSELSRKLKSHNIHICLETCGLYNRELFDKELLPFLDLVYFDIKIYDRESHKKYCGVPNDIILQNFKALFASSTVKVVPRIPLIPGITMMRENLAAIHEYLQECGVKEIGLLPYNPLWLSKPKTIGAEQEYGCSEWLGKADKDEVKMVFQDFVFKDF